MTMSSDNPRLVVIHPSQLAGTVLPVGPGRRSLGRGHAADLRLDDPHVSSIHAALSQADGQTSVEDLGSRNGTLVNGEPVRRPQVLHDGDVVQFGMVRARYEVPGSTGMMPPARPVQDRPVRFDIDRQTGGQINNVGRDQHHHYVQERDSFLRHVAAARTRSLRLIWLSLALMFSGGLVYLWGIYIEGQARNSVTGDDLNGYMNDYLNSMENSGPGKLPPMSPGLRHVVEEVNTAMSVEMIGRIIGAVGVMLFLLAVIMHIVAAARGRKVDTDPRHAWNAPAQRRRVGEWD
ncbi:FHA domain-containing protein [Microbispora rosea]|uniref:FHA domain-containing protein n=1 Tax=Microbispora rosea TaxID=58117 RepID=UPI003D919974